jgi:hypothetical protein
LETVPEVFVEIRWQVLEEGFIQAAGLDEAHYLLPVLLRSYEAQSVEDQVR